MPKVSSGSAVSFVSLLAVLSCGVQKRDIPIETLSAETVEALCSTKVRCGEYVDKRTCSQAVVSRRQVMADVASGIVEYDPSAAADCLDAYASLGCNISDQGTVAEDLRACREVFKGAAPDGTACLDNAECVSLLCNRAACGNDACCPGTCQSPIKIGGDCSEPGSICADTAVCTSFASNVPAICMRRTAAGEACDNLDTCAIGSVCNVDASTGQGVCGAPPAEGQPCPGRVCDASRDFCDPTSGVCVARLPVNGQCTSSEQCLIYAVCDPASGRCVARKGAGLPCVDRDECVQGLGCQAGACTPPTDHPACVSGDAD